MKPKKIAILGSCGLNGGLQIHFKELEVFLRNEGYVVFAVKINDGDKHINQEHKKTVNYVRSDGSGFLDKILKFWDWFCAIQKAKAFNADIFISTACGSGYAYFGKSMPKSSSGIFQIVTDDYQPMDKTILNMLQGHEFISVQSKGLIDPLKSKMQFVGEVGVLPCFHQIEISRLCAKPPKKDECLRLAYFGRLAGNKGLVLLLQTMTEIDEEFDWIFDIWGRGSEEMRLRELIAGNELLSKRVSLKGPYPAGEHYNELMAGYHGLLAPSQATEGLPLVLLEASSAGLPFLSCRIGAIGDCEYGNPDILIIETGEKALKEGLLLFFNHLRNGVYDNHRLKLWFESNHTRKHYESIWRKMLESPREYFGYE